MDKTVLLLFLYSLLACLHILTNANLEEITSLDREPPYNICSNSNSSYAADSPLQNNLQSDLFSSISSNASVTKFSNSSSETGSGRVYGLHMCLNYKSTTLNDCKNCIDTASDDISRLCPSKKEAVVWEDSCLLRYSDDNFFGKLDVSGNIPRANYKNVSEPERYKSVVNTILSNLITRAVSDPANNLSATDETHFTSMDTVYALVQCTRDLSPDACNSCLQDATREILSCCYFSRGARVYSRSCFLRYELYDFVNGASESPASGGNQVKGKGSQTKTWMIMIITIVVTFLLVVLLGFTVYYLTKMKRTQKRKSEVVRQFQLHKVGDSNNADFYHGQNIQGTDNLEAKEFHIDLKTIHLATENFSDSYLLGQGGFGPVYKGVLSDGKEVAIKRLSSYSEQGIEEFTNEVLLIMKLQHKNLVRLLGFCAEGEEKLLVYEYMPNSSLDLILFDIRKREQLDWSRRIHIINGIAKGILYLHVDSRLRIIHRDLKASNILLDSDMNPKISDFGMARILGSEGETSTIRIVGTYGYMAPEYAMEGLYSIKSDVFSFGILLLEILTGQKNARFRQTKNATSLIAYAWQLWNEGNALELMDPLLTDACGPEEFLRYIHIGLLCVQEDAFDRPTMSSVVVMLKGETVTLHQPGKPPFWLGRVTEHHKINDSCSVNDLTVSDVLPR